MASFSETAAEIARESGAIIKKYLDQKIGFELKGEFDLVTEADRTSEALIVKRLRERFPAHSILAEEGSGSEKSSEYRWYVDPLDGTTNLQHTAFHRPRACAEFGIPFEIRNRWNTTNDDKLAKVKFNAFWEIMN